MFKKHIKFTAFIGAMLSVSLLANSCISSGAYTIAAEARYPEMAKYPEGEMLPGFEDRYDAWRESIKSQRENFGAGENLGEFFTKTISKFLLGKDDENRIYSPLNVYMALAMLAEITDNESRDQILSLLNAEDIDALRAQAKKIWLANYSDDGAVTSILASSLWLNDTVKFKQDTLNSLADNYYASTYHGKMGSKGLNEALQKWLNEQTGGLLKDYVSGIELTPETVMALYTTIYFQAKWENEFLKSETKKQTFHAPSGDTECDFMNKSETYGIYYFGEKFGATRLGLKNSGSMYFILPDEGVTTEELLADSEALGFMVANGDFENSKSLRVNISMPRFDVKSKIDLSNGLKNLGITDCFNGSKADFSPLLEGGGVWLDRVNHGARVKVDEEGVEAAAYTEMLLCGAAMPPEDEMDFVLDRPFIFVITGSDDLPLFVGTVNNP
ncbi:MAG: serpin family protein [Ruminococcaceae bacterium]|nr:serpin family protein [Oscillospiraceae bacterium]